MDGGFGQQLREVTVGSFRGYRMPGFPLRHLFFTREGGESAPPYAALNTAYRTDDPAAPGNRRRLFSALRLDPRRIHLLNPCHGERIAYLDDPVYAAGPRARVLLKTDAAFTSLPDHYLVVSTADCIPALITAAGGRFAGVVHLGWRNLAADFPGRVVASVSTHYRLDPATFRVLLGPAIHRCCYLYETPQQLKDPFWGPFLHRVDGERFAIDLLSACVHQFMAAGVGRGAISQTGLCTGCRTEVFHSCYRDGYTSGRAPTIVGLAPAPPDEVARGW